MPSPRSKKPATTPAPRQIGASDSNADGPAQNAEAPALPQRAGKVKAASLGPSGNRAAAGTGPVHPDSMSAELIEFLTAIDRYKRDQQRPFPSFSEIFQIVRALGYEKSTLR